MLSGSPPPISVTKRPFMTILRQTEFQKTDEAVTVSVVRNSSWGGVVVGISVVCWGVTNTGWHGGRCGTSGPTARANSVALGGLPYVYQ